MKIWDTLIVGAGISGLNFAHAMMNKKESILILEKSRGVGGRIATRRIDDQGFDHGLPSFDLVPECHKLIQKYLYQPHEGMNSVLKKMANGLTVEKNHKVNLISLNQKNWQVSTESGEIFNTLKLVISAPLPQALELLEKSNLDFPEELSAISYSKRILVLMTSQNMPNLAGLNFGDHSLISMKERGLHPHGFIFMASKQFSEQYFEESDEALMTKMNGLIQNLVGKAFNFEHREIKKWRYSEARSPYSKPFVEIKPSLYLIGDAFLCGGISGALQSSQALAQHLS